MNLGSIKEKSPKNSFGIRFESIITFFLISSLKRFSTLLLTHIIQAIQSVNFFPIRGFRGFIMAMYLKGLRKSYGDIQKKYRKRLNSKRENKYHDNGNIGRFWHE